MAQILRLLYDVDYIHEIFVQNNFNSFKILMSSWVSEINRRNSKEEFPLQLRLKQQISDNFISSQHPSQVNSGNCLLLLSWLTLKYSRSSFVRELIRSDKDIFEVTGIHLGKVRKRNRFNLISFLVNRRVNIAYCGLKTNMVNFWNELTNYCSKLYTSFSYNLFKQYNPLIENLDCICLNLIWYVILLVDVLMFKSIWPMFYDEIVPEEDVTLLNSFFDQCRYPSLEFSQCLCLMFHFPEVSQYLDKKDYFRRNLVKDMITTFDLKQIERQDRLRIIYKIPGLLNVNIFDIERMHLLYKFNEEVVILIHHINFDNYKNERLHLNRIRKFIIELENNSTLKISNLENLGMVWRKAYAKLLNSMAEENFDGNIRMKLKILNSVPSLFDITNFHFQKQIQKMYDIDSYGRFCMVVKTLNLPNVIENSICFRPPLYVVKKITV